MTDRVRGMSRRVAFGVGVAACVLSAVPVAGASTRIAAAPATSRPCTDAAVVSCLLPYPSDRWQVSDPTTATGVRVVVPADAVPANLARQLGPGASVEAAFAGADGFSALSPVYFELPTPVEPSTLPADGGDAFVIYDVTTGRRVPIRAEVSLDAERLGAGKRIVVAWPAVRFDYGHRVIAVLTDHLRGPQGATLPRPAGFATPQSSAASDRLSAMRADLAAAAPAIPWASVVTATAFTVRSQANVTDDVDRMAAVVRATDHPIRGVRIGPSLIGGAAAVTGQVRVTDFRNADGVIPAGGTGSVSQRWVDFVMTMPAKPASAAGAPVAIYGHGLMAFKETMIAVAPMNASKGIATVGIDVPNHGSRQNEGGWLFDLATPKKFGRLTSMPLQGELDELSLLMAIKSHFSEIDLMPWTWWSGSSGDGRADLDTSRVLYEGTSMGGFLGASFASLAPELDGAFFQVAGSGILDTLAHSILWLLFAPVEPSGAKPGDAQALIATATMLLDRADNTNVLDRLAASDMPVWLAYARQDGTVPNTSSNRMIALLDLPLDGRQMVPVPPGIARVAAMPLDGRGASQIPTFGLDANPFKALLAHTSFADPQPMRVLSDWLSARLAQAHR